MMQPSTSDATESDKIRYSDLLSTSNDDDEVDGQYRSIFTYAAYNDLDNMGYNKLNRHQKYNGPRYSGFTYTKSIPVARQGEAEDDDECPSGSRIIERGNYSPFNRLLELTLIGICYAIVVFTLPMSLLFTLKFVQDFERLVIFRLGRARYSRGPGSVIVLPCIDSWRKVDVRIKAFNVPPLQLISQDHGLVEFGATVYFRIKDALAAVLSVQDWNQATRTLARSMLHRYFCKERVGDICNAQRRKLIISRVQEELGRCTFNWGMEITEIDLSDIKVLKEGENMAVNVLQKLVKTEIGTEIWNKIAPTIQEFASAHNNMQQPLVKPSATTNNDGGIDLNQLVAFIADSLTIDPTLVGQIGYCYEVHCIDVGTFFMDLRDGAGRVEIGNAPAGCDVRFDLDKYQLVQIFTGRLSPVEAYMSGAVTIKGSTAAAMKLKVLGTHLKTRCESRSMIDIGQYNQH